MAEVDKLLASYNAQEEGGSSQPSALGRAASLLGTAAVGVFAYRYMRGTAVGREITETLTEAVRSSRIFRTIEHLSHPYIPSGNAAGLIPQEFAIKTGEGYVRQLRVMQTGLSGVVSHTRNAMEQEMIRESSGARTIGQMRWRERFAFEKEFVQRSASAWKQQAADVWKLYGNNPMLRRELGAALPDRYMSQADRFFLESAQAARQVPVKDRHVFTPAALDRLLTRKDLPEEIRQAAEAFRKRLNTTHSGLLDAAMRGSERFGHTSARASHELYNELIKQEAPALFSKVPKLGWPERLAAGCDLRPETFQDVVRRLGHNGKRRAMVFGQGVDSIAEIPVSAYEEAMKAAPGKPLYTGRFIDRGRVGKVWDPYTSSIRNVAFSTLKLLGNFKIPLVDISPAHLLMPKELEQWYGQGKMVQPIRGGRYLWVADGRRTLTGRQAGHLLDPQFTLLGGAGALSKEDVRDLSRTFEQAARKISVTEATARGHLTEEQIARLHERVRSLPAGQQDELNGQLLDALAARLRPSELREAMWKGRASGALSGARFSGFAPYTSKSFVPGTPIVLTPSETALGTFLAANRGERLMTPLPDEILEAAQARREWVPHQRPEDFDAYSRWVAKGIRGLSAIGLDPRQSPRPSIPVRAVGWIAELFGKEKPVLYAEDYGVSWASVIAGGGRFKSAFHARYEERTSAWTTDFMIDQLEATDRAGGVWPWRGLRLEAVPRKRAEIEPDDLAELIERVARDATEKSDWGRYRSLYRQEQNFYGETRTGYFGKVIDDEGKPVFFDWVTRPRTVFSQKAEWTVATEPQLNKAFQTWAMYRPLAVLDMIGMGGFDLTKMKGPLDVLKAGAGRVATLYYGYQAFQYGDYALEQLTGFSPVKTAVAAGAAMDVARRALLTPVIWGAKAAETLEPGVITSPLSYAARTLGPMAIGAAIAHETRNPWALAIGAAAGLRLGGDLTIGAGEAADIYSGEENVPVRKGRYWGMSDGSFFGEQITQWRPHWVARTLLDQKFHGYPYKDQRQYWQTQSFVPVPENWFGLRPLLHPYEQDEYLQTVGAPTVMSSPHPITQIPLVGPLLTPLGYLFKPPRQMHPELPLPTESAEDAAGRSTMQSLATRNNLALAEDGLAANDADVEGPYSIKGAFRRFMRYAEELGGIYSWFTFSSIRGATGIREGGSYHYETADDDVSASADYWERDLGGGFGLTEFWRRLLPKPRYADQAISNVPNEMPQWLPGADEIRGRDFHYGNQYGKIPMGELILPGGGYEARRPEVAGLDPENYPAWAKLEVLTSASPFSTEARMAAEEVATGLDEMEGRIRSRSERLLEEYEETTGDNLFRSLDDSSGLGMLSGFLGLRAGKLGGRGNLSSFVKHRLVGSEMERWEDPIETIAEPAFNYAGYQGGPLGGATRGAAMGALFGGNAFTTAFGAALGGALGLYTGTRAASTVRTSGEVWMSEKAQKRIAITEYFDKLRFVKAVSLYNRTKDPVFLEASTRTMYGADPFGETWRVLGALPESDRKYVQSFLPVEKADERNRILAATPGYIDRILSAQWAMQDAAAGKLSKLELEDLKKAKTAAWIQNQIRLAGQDPELEGFFGKHYLPSSSWSGWNMDVPVEAAEAQLVNEEGLDAQEFGIWQGEQARFERMNSHPIVPAMGTPTPGGTSGARRRLRDLLHPQQRNFESLTQVESSNSRSETYVEVERSPYREVRALVRYGF